MIKEADFAENYRMIHDHFEVYVFENNQRSRLAVGSGRVGTFMTLSALRVLFIEPYPLLGSYS